VGTGFLMAYDDPKLDEIGRTRASCGPNAPQQLLASAVTVNRRHDARSARARSRPDPWGSGHSSVMAYFSSRRASP
jgi:hypothetical protein